MKPLLFTHDSIYYLQKLSMLVRQKTGVKHHLSQSTSLINLLRYSGTTTDTIVSMTYGDFMMTLDNEQQQYLQGRGLLIPLTNQDLMMDENNQLSARQ